MPMTSLEKLLELLLNKVRINFGNAHDAFQFFDCSMQGNRCKREHFVFSLAFLSIDHDYKEVLELFDLLDSKQKGYIDESDFEQLFEGVQGTWNSQRHDIK